jgi:hypothetical protein
MRKLLFKGLVLAVAGAGCQSAVTTENASPVVPTGGPSTATGAAGSGAAQVQPALPSGASTPTPSSGAAGAPSGPPSVATNTAAPGAATGSALPSGSSTTPPAASAATPAGNLPAATGGAISDTCRGFDFSNVIYSPGGEVLPNKCEAFHATLNNPYALRCIDAWPWYKTMYPGDAFCVLPPPPDKGTQLGHHPQGEGNAWFEAMMKQDLSGYINEPPAGWTLPPGGEEERNILVRHTNMAGKYYRIYNRMRGGSHHMIVSSVDSATATFTWGAGGADGLFNGRTIPGAQRPDDNTPQVPTIPEEDDGLYRELPQNVVVQYNMHHFNSMDKPILKEAWQNVWWTDNAKTAVSFIQGLPLLQAVGTFANPGEIVDFHYASTAPAPFRVLGLFGHRHAWTPSFTAWVERPGKPEEIVYQSFDWFDEPTFQYNSQVKNPPVSTAARQDGATSGIVSLEAGDKLHFNCHIEYTDEREREVSSPVTPTQNGPLRFANQAYNAEMCILFGASVGDNGTMEQLGPPPDFAKIR